MGARMGRQAFAPWGYPFVAFLTCVALLILSASAVQAQTWQAIGPEGGNFVGVVVNPANAAEVTVVCDVGDLCHVYRTTNGGASWRRIGQIPESRLTGFQAVSFTTLYATGYTAFYRSTDGGMTWRPTEFTQAYGNAKAMCVDPNNPNTIYIAGAKYTYDSGDLVTLMKSMDAGASWSGAIYHSYPTYSPQGIAMAKSAPGTFYIVGSYITEDHVVYPVVLKSTDGGGHLNDIAISFPGLPARAVAVDPVDANLVFIGDNSGICRSTNGGAQWTRLPTGGAPATVFAFNPGDSSRVYAYVGTSKSGQMYISADHGQYWTPFTTGFPGEGQQISVAAGTPGDLYVATGAALIKSNDYGGHWVSAQHGLQGQTIEAFAVSPSNPVQMILCQKDTGLFSSADNGATWTTRSAKSAEPCDMLIHPTKPSVVLGAFSTLSRSGDSGANWITVSQGLKVNRCVTQNPMRPDMMFAGGDSDNNTMKILRSDDGGVNWWVEREIVVMQGTSCYDISMASSAPVLYAGGTSMVFRSDDAGLNWRDVTSNLSSVLGSTRWEAQSVIVHPSLVDICYVGTNKGVAVTINGGVSWIAFGCTKPVTAMAYHATTNRLFVATTGDGVCVRYGDGTWTQMIDGLNTLACRTLYLEPSTDNLYVGTDAGVYRANVAALPTTTTTPASTTTTQAPPTTTLAPTTTAAPGSTTTVTGESTTTSVTVTTSTSSVTTTTLASADHIGICRTGASGLTWALDMNGNCGWDSNADEVVSFGDSGDVAVVGDWNGDGRDKLGIFRRGVWALDYNGNGRWDGPMIDRVFQFGDAGDTPVVGNWSGTGGTKVGVVRATPGGDLVWVLDYNGNGQWDGPGVDRVLGFGIKGDMPIVGDWSGSGRAGIGIVRPVGNDLCWALDYNGNGAWDSGIDRVFGFGNAGDQVVVGDWNGDGRDKAGIRRGATWAVDYNGSMAWEGQPSDRIYSFGDASDKPVVGKWPQMVTAPKAATAPARPAATAPALPAAAPAHGTAGPVRAAFDATPTDGALSLEVRFRDLSTGAVQGWTWDFGDGSTSNERNPVHVYTEAGAYTVTLMVSGQKDLDTCRKEAYVTVWK